MLKFICKWVIWRSFSVCPVHFPNCNTSSVTMNQQPLANIGYEKENVLKCSTNFIIIWGLQDISSYDGCLWGQVKWRGHLLMVKTDRKFQTTSPKMVAVTYKRWLLREVPVIDGTLSLFCNVSCGKNTTEITAHPSDGSKSDTSVTCMGASLLTSPPLNSPCGGK